MLTLLIFSSGGVNIELVVFQLTSSTKLYLTTNSGPFYYD